MPVYNDTVPVENLCAIYRGHARQWEIYFTAKGRLPKLYRRCFVNNPSAFSNRCSHFRGINVPCWPSPIQANETRFQIGTHALVEQWLATRLDSNYSIQGIYVETCIYALGKEIIYRYLGPPWNDVAMFNTLDKIVIVVFLIIRSSCDEGRAL